MDVAALRELGETRLAELLRRRPDTLVSPAPESLTDLAERLLMPAGVVGALRRQDRPTLQVAEAIAALGGQASRAALDRLLGSPEPAAVDRALAQLAAFGLLVAGPDPALVDAARAAWPHPLGLGPPIALVLAGSTVADLRVTAKRLGLPGSGRREDVLAAIVAFHRDPERVRSVLAGAPADVRHLLQKVAATGEHVPEHRYFSARYSEPRTPNEWALAHGMLVRLGEWSPELLMPAEVALALRGPEYTAPFTPQPPPVASAAVDPAVVAEGAAAAGSALVRLAGAVLDEAGRAPVPTLRGGGVGVRELRRLVKALGCTEAELRLVLALAYDAELLSISDGHLLPTAEYDEWVRGEPAERLAELLAVWWSLPYAPTTTAGGAWQPDAPADGAADLRAALLAACTGAATDPAALGALVEWRSPYAFGDPVTVPSRALACWQEAALLGVVAAGAVSPTGRALLAGDDLVEALGDLGGAQHTVLLQADLTAVVAGTPTADLAALLDAAADPESRSTAATWRFSPASVRRALDAGHTPESLVAQLGEVAVGGLPQPLAYLIADVARRHGGIRASAVACCLRGEDTALLAEVLADRRLRALGLRRLAPTVLAGTRPLDETLAALRAAGYAPLAEDADGVPVLERPVPRRAAPVRRVPRRARPPVAPADPAALAQALLAAPDRVLAAPSRPDVLSRAVHLTEAEKRILAHAIAHGGAVAIEYVNRDGNESTRVIEELELAESLLYAWCRLRDDQRAFNLGRILRVEPAA